MKKYIVEKSDGGCIVVLAGSYMEAQSIVEAKYLEDGEYVVHVESYFGGKEAINQR